MHDVHRCGGWGRRRARQQPAGRSHTPAPPTRPRGRRSGENGRGGALDVRRARSASPRRAAATHGPQAPSSVQHRGSPRPCSTRRYTSRWASRRLCRSPNACIGCRVAPARCALAAAAQALRVQRCSTCQACNGSVAACGSSTAARAAQLDALAGRCAVRARAGRSTTRAKRRLCLESPHACVRTYHIPAGDVEGRNPRAERRVLPPAPPCLHTRL